MNKSLSVKCNDVELSDYLIVSDLRRGVGTTRTNKLQKMGLSTGSDYIGFSHDYKTYEMDFVLRYDLIEKRRKLAGILNVDEPVKVVFGDEPDKYVLAVPDGDINVDENNFIGKGTIVWLIPDGLSYSNVIKSSTATLDENGILSVTVDNQGTDSTELNVQAEFNSDNGVFATITPYQIIEVGSSEEMDGHTYQATDVVAKNTLIPADKVNWVENSPDARTIYPISVSGVTNSFGSGSFNWPSGSEGPTPVYTNRGPNKWAGPTLHRSFDANSNDLRTGNFEWIWRFNHKNTSANQGGRQEFNLQSGSEVPFAFVLRDSTKSKIEAIAEFYLKPLGATKAELTSVRLDLKKIKSNWWEVRLTRIGEKLTFRLSNIKKVTGDYGDENVKESYYTITQPFTDDRFVDVPVDSTTYWAQAGDSSTAPLDIHPTNFSFRWINVDKWSDDPNRYTTGDVMYIDSSNTKVLLNGIPILNDVVKGSEYLKIPPGKTEIQFAYSSFATTPTVKVFWQEVFL